MDVTHSQTFLSLLFCLIPTRQCSKLNIVCKDTKTFILFPAGSPRGHRLAVARLGQRNELRSLPARFDFLKLHYRTNGVGAVIVTLKSLDYTEQTSRIRVKVPC